MVMKQSQAIQHPFLSQLVNYMDYLRGIQTKDTTITTTISPMAAGNGGGFHTQPNIWLYSVITSYSIHYTKLYEVYDTLNATRIIIGTEDDVAKKMLLDIYAPFDLPIVSVSRRSAEMIKYACNNFLALKISYMNDIANLCELVGANIDDVAEGMRYDPRIGAKFLKAGVGYGGSCFPKDTKALTFLARQHGTQLKTVDAAVKINATQKTRLFEKAKKRLMTFENVKVAVLGLAFKPGTDDLREAPALDNVRLLLEHGADVVCYDPIAAANFHKLYPQVKMANSVEETLEGAFVITSYSIHYTKLYDDKGHKKGNVVITVAHDSGT